jgi:hypothetical protein
MQLLLKTGTGGSNVSHAIFQISPTNTNTNQWLSECQFETVSRWALDLVLRQYETHKANVTANFYHNISVIPGAALLQRHLFEWQVLNHLNHIPTEYTFPIRRLIDFKQMMWTYRGPIDLITFQESTVLDEITKAIPVRKPLHLVPLVRNFLAVDSILYDPDDPDTALTCIQITMNKDHAIVVSGLRLIQSWLQQRTALGGLCLTETRPWRFLFVVPLGMASTFKLQKLDGDTANGEWAGKVHQYVLGLEEQTIFGRYD